MDFIICSGSWFFLQYRSSFYRQHRLKIDTSIYGSFRDNRFCFSCTLKSMGIMYCEINSVQMWFCEDTFPRHLDLFFEAFREIQSSCKTELSLRMRVFISCIYETFFYNCNESWADFFFCTYIFWRLEIGFVEQDVSLSFIPDQQTQYSPIIEHILNPEKEYNQHIQYSVAIEQQEGILVECQLPAYRHYGRHSEQFRTCPRGDEDRGYKGSVQGPLPCEQAECQTGWHGWKHYLPTTSLVRAKYTTIF